MNASKIALFLQDLSGGGAERMMVNLAGGLAARGIPVDLVLVREEGPLLTRVPSCVRIVPLGTRRVLFSVPALVRYLRREQPSALLSTLVHVNLAAILARQFSGTGTRLILRESNYVSVNRRKVPYPLIRLAYRLIPFVYPLADRVVAVSGSVAADILQFARLSPERVVVVPNPVVTGDLTRLADKPVEHPWFAKGAPPVILGVGRLVEQKDFSTLIRSFSLVRQRRVTKLVILGEGPLRNMLVSLIRKLGLEDDVDLPGFVVNPYPWLRRAAVFVLSSAWEGSPNVLVEAMACGTGVISTDCPGGAREILQDGKCGDLVPPRDAKAMAEAILRRLATSFDAEPARRRSEHFSVEQVVGRYAALLLQG